MKKLIFAATAIIFLAGAAYANQQCFYGKNCKDGKIVQSAEKSGFIKHHIWAKKKMWTMMSKNKECAMMKDGAAKQLPCRKALKKQKITSCGCECCNQAKPHEAAYKHEAALNNACHSKACQCPCKDKECKCKK